MRDAVFNDGTMWPVNSFGSPGILMLHTCVDHIVVQLVKFILTCFVATCLLSTSTLSMMKIAVAPVSAIALFAAKVCAFKYCDMGLPMWIELSPQSRVVPVPQSC